MDTQRLGRGGERRGSWVGLGDENVVFPAHCRNVAYSRTSPQTKQGEEAEMFQGEATSRLLHCINFELGHARALRLGAISLDFIRKALKSVPQISLL